MVACGVVGLCECGRMGVCVGLCGQGRVDAFVLGGRLGSML